MGSGGDGVVGLIIATRSWRIREKYRLFAVAIKIQLAHEAMAALSGGFASFSMFNFESDNFYYRGQQACKAGNPDPDK